MTGDKHITLKSLKEHVKYYKSLADSLRSKIEITGKLKTEKSKRILKIKNMRREFKVGDRVFDIRYGWGKVEYIDGNEEYSVLVNFKPRFGYVSYTSDGREYPYENPILSHTHPLKKMILPGTIVLIHLVRSLYVEDMHWMEELNFYLWLIILQFHVGYWLMDKEK